MYLLNVIFLVALAGYASSATIDDCPSQVPRDNLKVFKDKCYRFTMHRQRDWPGALAECQSFGGTLALVKSKEINDFLVKALTAYPRGLSLWIGLTDLDTEGDFYWEDRTKLDYSNWAPNQGTLQDGFLNSKDDCVSMGFTGTWYDYPCQSTTLSANLKSFICEYQITAPAATTAST